MQIEVDLQQLRLGSGDEWLKDMRRYQHDHRALGSKYKLEGIENAHLQLDSGNFCSGSYKSTYVPKEKPQYTFQDMGEKQSQE